MKSIDGKQVLLIAPHFFGYEDNIATELRNRGAQVDFLPDRPFQSSLMKAVTRVRRELILSHADRFFWNALEELGRKSYDLILVVQGEGVSPRFLSSLRTKFPNASFVLYMWDSFRNKKSLIPNIDHFDKCLTFDPDDAKKYGMEFRPLFYSRNFSDTNEQSLEYDISFIGTMHSDRYRIVSNVVASLPTYANCYRYLYLQAQWVFWMHKVCNSAFKGASIGEFKFESLAKSEVQRVFIGSRAVLDIEHPDQTGLTMRTFETLGARKKLVTTNQKVREYDFFNSQNIFVIDRNNVHVSQDFFDAPYVTLPNELYVKYSLQGWTDEVIA